MIDPLLSSLKKAWRSQNFRLTYTLLSRFPSLPSQIILKLLHPKHLYPFVQSRQLYWYSSSLTISLRSIEQAEQQRLKTLILIEMIHQIQACNTPTVYTTLLKAGSISFLYAYLFKIPLNFLIHHNVWSNIDQLTLNASILYLQQSSSSFLLTPSYHVSSSAKNPKIHFAPQSSYLLRETLLSNHASINHHITHQWIELFKINPSRFFKEFSSWLSRHKIQSEQIPDVLQILLVLNGTIHHSSFFIGPLNRNKHLLFDMCNIAHRLLSTFVTHFNSKPDVPLFQATLEFIQYYIPEHLTSLLLFLKPSTFFPSHASQLPCPRELNALTSESYYSFIFQQALHHLSIEEKTWANREPHIFKPDQKSNLFLELYRIYSEQDLLKTALLPLSHSAETPNYAPKRL